MKKLSFLIFSILCFLPLSVFAIPSIQHWQTKQGAQVYFIASPSVPMLNVKLLFNAGSVFDDKHLGLAALTNSLFAEGAADLGAKTIADGFDNIGADFDASVDKLTASLDLQCLTDKKSLADALNLFHLVVTQLSVSNKGFLRVKNQLITAIKQTQQDPDAVAEKNFYRLLYGANAYANPVLGTIPTVKQLTQKQTMQFYHGFYTTHNLKVLIVGDITRAQAEQIAEQVTVGLPQGEAKTFQGVDQPLTKSATTIVNFPANQSYIWMGNFSISTSNPDKYALLIANQILGGDGLTSLLANVVREQHSLTYAIGSDIVPAVGLRPFVITLQTKNQTRDQAIQLTKQTVANFVKQGPSIKQIKLTKDYLVGSFPLSFSSNRQLLGIMTYLVKYHYPLDYLQTYVKNVEQVTPQQVNVAIKKYIDPNKFLIVSVGGKS